MTRALTARRVVLGLAAAAFVTGAVTLWRTGAVTPYSLKTWIEAAIDALGPGAPVLFIVAFAAGSFVGLPGMAFVIGGRLAFGPYVGFAVGLAGGMLAVTLPFVVARRVRGATSNPWWHEQRHLARAFEMLDTHPFRAVLLLRLVLWFNPPLSYALAFTTIRLRTYVVACACALAPVVAIAMAATSWFV